MSTTTKTTALAFHYQCDCMLREPIFLCPCRAQSSVRTSCGVLIDVMEACEDRYCDDLCSLGASMRRKWHRRAGRTLSNRTVWAPAVEVPDILGQDFLQMALIEDEHVVEALGPDRSHPALDNRVRPRRSERCARLGNTEITHPPIEAGGITAVAVVNEKAPWQQSQPQHSTICCAVHSAVGCPVTSTWRTCRLA
jgi:hypothetical protein